MRRPTIQSSRLPHESMYVAQHKHVRSCPSRWVGGVFSAESKSPQTAYRLQPRRREIAQRMVLSLICCRRLCRKMEKEKWVPVPKEMFSTFYEVSNRGRIRRTRAAQGTRAGHIRKSQLGQKGYLIISLSTPRLRKTFAVHRLVALAFCKGDKSLGVHHRDGDRANPRARNLRFAKSIQDNEFSREARGRTPGSHARNNRKLTAEQVIEIREAGRARHDTKFLTELGAKYGVAVGTMHAVIFGRTWKSLPIFAPEHLRPGPKRKRRYGFARLHY
jgi:hypothetical protein